MSLSHFIEQHYASNGLLDRIQAGLAEMGLTPERATLEHLGQADEFHVRSAGATVELIELLAPDPAMRVLDLGSGLGGPARRLADATGCRVTGIDLCRDFCAAGTVINDWLGLADRVDLIPGDATDLGRFGPESFDAAWTIHTAMNIQDRSRFYGEVARVLRPGGRFLSYDLFAADGREPVYPVPWAADPSASFLVTLDQMLGHLAAAGFEVERTLDQTAAGIEFLTAGLAKMAGGPRPALGPHLVMGSETALRLGNVARNLSDGRIALATVLARRPG